MRIEVSMLDRKIQENSAMLLIGARGSATRVEEWM
jgi:hypothetical protein